MRIARPALAVVVLAGLAACATTPALDTASRERAVQTSAVVEAVNPGEREVMLRTAEGRFLTLVAGPEVRNFDQIEAGDLVTATYVESVVVRMAEPGAAAGTAAVAVERAAEGARPGIAVGTEVTTTVRFVDFDPATDLATFTTLDGLTHSLVVDPAMRDFAMRRRPGDRIDVTFTESVVLTIRELQG